MKNGAKNSTSWKVSQGRKDLDSPLNRIAPKCSRVPRRPETPWTGAVTVFRRHPVHAAIILALRRPGGHTSLQYYTVRVVQRRNAERTPADNIITTNNRRAFPAAARPSSSSS